MKDLIKTNRNLPASIDELQKFILISKERLKVVAAQVNGIRRLGLSKNVYDQKLTEAQDLGGVVLLAEAKMGEFLKNTILSTGSNDATGTKLKDIGIDKSQSSRAQKLADHQDIIEEVIAESHATDDIPTRKEVFRKVQEQSMKEKRNIKVKLPEGKYDVILADPPWQYDNTGLAGMIEKQGHYPTMPLEDICSLKVPSAENAVLFLWVTNPFLKESFEVIEKWGFEYKTNIVWVKKNLKKPGIGFYVRGRHELLLICTKGNFTPDLKGKTPIGSVVEADIQEHSKKPDIIYEIIENLYPDGRYLELFARNKRDKWTSWGNAVELL